MSFKVVAKKNTKIAKDLQCKTPKKSLRGSYRQICPMSHKMHTHDKCNILTLDGTIIPNLSLGKY
jgi:hypothetical protein